MVPAIYLPGFAPPGSEDVPEPVKRILVIEKISLLHVPHGRFWISVSKPRSYKIEIIGSTLKP
ncbi:MAG: hypothetical protein DRN03_01385 [Thermoplasmata archaeon]|nr:MAG: hypothetical protein DRN03_01385 [Thermoplasmata archaeon]